MTGTVRFVFSTLLAALIACLVFAGHAPTAHGRPGAPEAPDIAVVPGDCNADGKTDAGDISALGLEVFDGDGVLAEDAPGGTFTGHPFGCDPNKDHVVDAADLPCDVLRLFGGPAACGLVRASVDPAQGEASVSTTRETIVRFTSEIDASTVTTGTIFAQFAGERLAARQHVSGQYTSADNSTRVLAQLL